MADLGELVSTLRADTRQWTQPLRQAQAEIKGAAAATAAASAEIARATSRQIGPTTAAAKALAAEQAALRAAAEAKAVLGVRARTVSVQIAQMTASVAGATGPLRQLSSVMLSLGSGSLAQLGVVVAITAVGGAIGLLTRKSREAAAELKSARKELAEFGKTAEDKLAETRARLEKTRDDLQTELDTPTKGGPWLARESVEKKLRKARAELAAFDAEQAAAKAGTPVDRANLAVEFSRVSTETAKSLKLLRDAEAELEKASTKANTPLKEQTQILAALRQVRERLKEMTPDAITGSSLTTSWEEDLRRRNRLGSEWMEGLIKKAQEVNRAIAEIGTAAPNIDVERAMEGSPARAILDSLDAVKDRAREVQAFANQLGQDISRSIAHGILGGRGSIAEALVDTFRYALAEVAARIIKEKLLDPIIALIGGVLRGSGKKGGTTWIPLPGIPFPVPFPFMQASPAAASIQRGASMSAAPVADIHVHFPAPAIDPVTASRDAQWLTVFGETNRQLEALGFRFRRG